MKDNMIT